MLVGGDPAALRRRRGPCGRAVRVPIAYRTQPTFKCNPENGHVLDDPGAMAFWQREYESGWKPVV